MHRAGAGELRKDLEAATGLALPPMLAFDYPTPEALVGCILDLAPPPPAAAPAEAPESPAAEGAAAAGGGYAEAGASLPAWQRLTGAARQQHVLQQVHPRLLTLLRRSLHSFWTQLLRLARGVPVSKVLNSHHNSAKRA